MYMVLRLWSAEITEDALSHMHAGSWNQLALSVMAEAVTAS